MIHRKKEVKHNTYTGLYELWLIEYDTSDKIYPIVWRWLLDVSEYDVFKK